MTNKATTRRALFMSFVALLLCFTMLLGTTFAWFTDSVSSARNTIKSGNLDVVLEYSKWDETTNTWGAYDEVDAETKVFADGALYEPGYTEVVKFKVTNAGSLALKYNMNVAINSETEGTNKASETFKLSNYLYVGVVDSVTDRDTAAAEATVKLGGGFAMKTSEKLEKNGDFAEFVLVLTMPTTVGNEANHINGKQPTIELGVDLTATQLDYESDSFDNKYDVDAAFEIATLEDLVSAFANGGTYKLAANIVVTEGILPTVAEGKTVVLDLAGYSITAENVETQYALNNLGNLTILDSKATTASTYSLRSAAAGSVSARGMYNGYDADGNHVKTAKITVLSGVFNACGTNGGGAAIFNYGVADIKGGTFTAVSSYALNNREGATMTISGETVGSGICNLGALTVENATISNTISGLHAVYHNGTSAVINGGTFENYSGNEVVRANAVGVEINGGTFNMNVDSYILGGNGITVNGGTFNGYETVGLRPGDAVSIAGGTFSFDPENFLAEGVLKVAIGEDYMVLPAGYEAVVDGLYKNGSAYIVTSADGFAELNAMMANKTAGKNVEVDLYADIDMTGKTWTPVDSHADTAFTFSKLNGNGYTVSNLTINGQAMFTRFAGSGDVTVKDVTFDNATVTSTTLNTSILTVQSYQNVLLDNVDVANSAITGAYKVAPLIATVYNENPSTTVTATLKNCDVSNTTVTATTYDFCTTGMVSYVREGDNDKIVFENCTVSDVSLFAPEDNYKAHAAIYTAGSTTLYDEAEGVTVTNVTFTVKK